MEHVQALNCSSTQLEPYLEPVLKRIFCSWYLAHVMKYKDYEPVTTRIKLASFKCGLPRMNSTNYVKLKTTCLTHEVVAQPRNWAVDGLPIFRGIMLK